jgi:hypothetical protein
LELFPLQKKHPDLGTTNEAAIESPLRRILPNITENTDDHDGSRAAPSGSKDYGSSEDSDSADSESSEDSASDSTSDSKEASAEVPDDERAADREATSPEDRSASINFDATMNDLDSPPDTRLNRSDKVSFNPTVSLPTPLVPSKQCKQPPTYSQAAATIPDPAAIDMSVSPNHISKTSLTPTQIPYKLKITIPPNTTDSTNEFVKTLREVFKRIQTHCGKKTAIGPWESENHTTPLIHTPDDIPDGKGYAGRRLWAEYFDSYLALKTHTESRDYWLNLRLYFSGRLKIPPEKWGLELQSIRSDMEKMQYADFEEAQEEAIPCHSRRGLTCESIMTHS